MAQPTPTAKPAAPREIKAVTTAIAGALETIDEARRPAVWKAAKQKMEAEAKARREKQATKHAREVKARALAKARATKPAKEVKPKAAAPSVAAKSRPAPKAARKRSVKSGPTFRGETSAAARNAGLSPAAPMVPANGSIPADPSPARSAA